MIRFVFFVTDWWFLLLNGMIGLISRMLEMVVEMKFL